MAEKNRVSLKLPAADDLFSTQKEREEEHLEKVIMLPPSEINDFPNHPFQVRMDEEMMKMTESIQKYGILVPCLVRPKGDGSYEMVSGHRRKTAASLAGKDSIPCIVRSLSDDEAIVVMVDSNLQREKILPSEKGFAYKMKLEAMKRQAGRPAKNNLTPVVSDYQKPRSNEELGKQVGESREQIRRYIRLTELVPELLSLVDEGKIALRPAVELSFLTEEQQNWLVQGIGYEDCTPSLAQAIKMRRFSDEKRLNPDVILSILSEEKPNQVEQVKIPKERITRYFPAGTSVKKMEETIIHALELYRKVNRDRQTR
jgi:hypothetical protein